MYGWYWKRSEIASCWWYNRLQTIYRWRLLCINNDKFLLHRHSQILFAIRRDWCETDSRMGCDEKDHRRCQRRLSISWHDSAVLPRGRPPESARCPQLPRMQPIHSQFVLNRWVNVFCRRTLFLRVNSNVVSLSVCVCKIKDFFDDAVFYWRLHRHLGTTTRINCRECRFVLNCRVNVFCRRTLFCMWTVT